MPPQRSNIHCLGDFSFRYDSAISQNLSICRPVAFISINPENHHWTMFMNIHDRTPLPTPPLPPLFFLSCFYGCYTCTSVLGAGPMLSYRTNGKRHIIFRLAFPGDLHATQVVTVPTENPPPPPTPPLPPPVPLLWYKANQTAFVPAAPQQSL